MRIKRRLVISTAALITASVVAISVASATTTTINPAGDNLLATSTNASFGLGSGSINCALAQTAGAIPKPEATSMKVHAPMFATLEGKKECSSTGLSGLVFSVGTEGAWELNTVSPTSASLTLPNTWSLYITVPGKKCTFTVAPGVTVSGTWINGVGRYQEETPLVYGKPSLLTFAKSSMSIEKLSVTECPAPIKEANSMTLSASFIVNDATNVGSNVLLK